MSASKVPTAVLVEAGGHDAGIAVPDRHGVRFYSGHFLFHKLDGQLFASLAQARIAALEIAASARAPSLRRRHLAA